MSVRSQVMKAIDANPGLPHSVLARKVAADIGEPGLVALATQRIERMIATERRKRIREIEDLSASREGGTAEEWATVEALLAEYREAVIVEWTAELRASEFAVGNGQTVTWGQATREQHIARIQMLTQNVRGNLSAIQRHEAALVTIGGATDATCLDEAVAQ